MRFPSWSGVFRGRKVVDRGEGRFPPFLPLAPVPPTAEDLAILNDINAYLDEKFGITTCPTCHEKVAVLIDGLCRDCGGDAA